MNSRCRRVGLLPTSTGLWRNSRKCVGVGDQKDRLPIIRCYFNGWCVLVGGFGVVVEVVACDGEGGCTELGIDFA